MAIAKLALISGVHASVPKHGLLHPVATAAVFMGPLGNNRMDWRNRLTGVQRTGLLSVWLL